MIRNDAVAAVTGEIFHEGWSRVRGSRQGLGAKRTQMVRAARGHRAAVFKAIRGGGTHTKAQLTRQLQYLTTKSSHVIDSRAEFDGKRTLDAGEIAELADRFTARWDDGFNPKLGHTTHLLMSYPVGTTGEDVRDISAAVAERFFKTEVRTFDYIIAVHKDRDHPHAHLVINRRAQEGEYFYLGRDHHFNYDAFRQAMVEEAETVGLRLEATRRVDRGVLTYPARTGEVYEAKADGRDAAERARVGADFARASAEIAMTSTIYRSLAAEASQEGREDIANALLKAGELLSRNGRLEPTGDIYMATEESFDDLRGRFSERAERVEAMIRSMPDGPRAAAEKQANAIYASMAHMQPLGLRSVTLNQAPSEAGVYSEANINRDLTGRMRDSDTRAQIETALRGTGISSKAVISRVEQGAENAALEREWLAQDLETIAKADGLNLERKEDLRVATDRLDEVHVKLGAVLERAEVLRDDGIVEVEENRAFHYDRQATEDVSRAIRQELRRGGAGEAELRDRTMEIETRAEARIEQEQRDYLRDRPEIVAAPLAVHTDEPYREEVVDRAAFERIGRETDAIMDRAGQGESVEDAVSRDFRERYRDMPDHLARGLGQTYARVEEMRNDEATARFKADRDGQGARELRDTPAIDAVVARERADPINASLPDEASRLAFRQEVEREISDADLDRLRDGDADALVEVIDDRLDRLYAAKAYLQSDEATANGEAVREVVSEIAKEEVDAQRLRHVQGHTEKGTTHG